MFAYIIVVIAAFVAGVFYRSIFEGDTPTKIDFTTRSAPDKEDKCDGCAEAAYAYGWEDGYTGALYDSGNGIYQSDYDRGAEAGYTAALRDKAEAAGTVND